MSLLRPRNLSTQWDSTALPPVTSPEYHENSPCLVHNWQLRIFISKSLTLGSQLGVRFIPTFGSNFGPKPQSRPHPLRLFAFIFFPSIARHPEEKCLSLPKPPAACRLNETPPTSLSVFPLSTIWAFKPECNSCWKSYKTLCLVLCCRVHNIYHSAESEILKLTRPSWVIPATHGASRKYFIHALGFTFVSMIS